MGRLAAAPVCYRKSVRFEELVGQEQATAILRRALVADRLAHAYLFEGPAGVGKRSAAVGLGMAQNCERSREAACGSIVDDADRLNANASNCLLKTLEEPLRGTHIVLVTNAPDKLLVTIRSRAQRIRFRRVSETTLQAFGASRGVDAAAGAVAAVLADGSVARFVELTRATEGDEARPSVVPAAARLRAAARDRGIAPIIGAAAGDGNKEAKQ